MASDPREVLSLIEETGYGSISDQSKRTLKYGLDKGLITQNDVDLAQTTYRGSRARGVLPYIEIMGLNKVRQNSLFSEDLEYGIKHGTITEEEVDAANACYKNQVGKDKSHDTDAAKGRLLDKAGSRQR